MATCFFFDLLILPHDHVCLQHLHSLTIQAGVITRSLATNACVATHGSSCMHWHTHTPTHMLRLGQLAHPFVAGGGGMGGKVRSRVTCRGMIHVHVK